MSNKSTFFKIGFYYQSVEHITNHTVELTVIVLLNNFGRKSM